MELMREKNPCQRLWNEKIRIYVSEYWIVMKEFEIDHSHASFPSKLLRATWNACNAHSGYLKSIVNTSSLHLPNCITIYSGSDSWTSWKFFTDAFVTRPWKLSTYDCVSSFQTGVLFRNSTRLSMLLVFQLSKIPWCASSEDILTRSSLSSSPLINNLKNQY